MNRDNRREFKKKACEALKNAKGFLLVVTDGLKMPVHFYDLTNLDKNDTDIRVIAMQNATGAALNAIDVLNEKLKERIALVEQANAAKTEITKVEESKLLDPMETGVGKYSE